jgi:hypothetical protein
MIPGASALRPESSPFRSGFHPLRKEWARKLVAWACAGALLVNTAGCYSHRQIDSASGLTSGQRVTLELTDQGRARLAEQLGGSVARVQGAVISQDGDQLSISVARVGYIGGTISNWSGETVRIQRADISSVQERQLAPVRTGLLAGGIIAALVVLTVGMDWIGFGSDDGRQQPGEEQPGDQ